MAWVDQHEAYLSACRRIAKELRTEPEQPATSKHDNVVIHFGAGR